MNIDNLPGRYWAGHASVEAGSTTVTPHDAAWAGNVWGDDLFFLPSQPLVPPQRIEQVNDDGSILLAYPWPGADAVEEEYEVRYVGIIERSTAQSRRVLEQLGDVRSWADIFVATDADRLALDTPSNPLRAGLRVLVIDDGVIWAKKTGAFGDWLPPVEFKGDQGDPGPFTNITFGPVMTLNPGQPASASVVQVNADTVRVDFSLPRGQDGTGTGDVVGPASSVSGRIALFSGTSGKALMQAGLSISDLQPAGSYEPTRTRVPLPEAQAGTATVVRGWAAADVAAAILALSPPSDTADLEFSVSQLALGLADANNVAQFLGPSGNRVADSFDALTYVDVAGATNLDTSVAGALKATVTGLAPSYSNPGGTGNRSSMITASTSLTPGGGAPIHLIDGAITDVFYCSAAAAAGHFIRFDFGTGGPYVITEARSYTNGGNVNDGVWKWQGSNDNTNWTDIGASFTLNSGNPSTTYPQLASNTVAYRYYRMLGVSGTFAGSNYLREYEFKIGTVAVAIPNNLAVRSASFSALAVPTKMKALIVVKKVGAATPGTHYVLDCSRNGGVNWSAMALTERYALPGGLMVVEAADTSVAGQPSGTAPQWRFRTLSNRNVELHDVYLYWN